MENLDALEDYEAYCRLFTDLTLWSPYVREVCDRHGFSPHVHIRLGVPGTCPVFMVEERWVVKFFGRLFEGGESFAVEREAARLVGQDPALQVARVVAEGELGGTGWPWPYLVFELIQGVSIGEVWEQVSREDRLRVAREMGLLAQRLHALPLRGSTVFPETWEEHARFLKAQRAQCVQSHRAWGTLPAHLVDQIGDFLPPTEALLDPARPPHLIHGDLTRDHLLGRLSDGCWHSQSLIDFGDAMTGSLLYELAALHLDLFRGDRTLLAVFLEAYGMPVEERAALPRLAMAAALLHRFNVLGCSSSEALQAGSLDELASTIWDVTGLVTG